MKPWQVIHPTGPDKAYRNRITALRVAGGVVAAAVLARAGAVQLFPNPRLEQLSKRQFQSKVLIRPRRGSILDRNGEPLAINVETNSLAANPSSLTRAEGKKSVARLISRATDLPYGRVLAKLGEKREFVWIKRHLTEEELSRLNTLGLMDAEGDLISGLWLVKESQRMYPHGNLAAHVLGGVNVDSEGIEGVELWLNDRLRGKVVSVNAIRDALGRPTFIDASAIRHLKEGENITLTLDASLQYEIERNLKDSIKKTGARAGTVIVMNAMNGEILAMANEPTFNPNDRGPPPSFRRNRGLTDAYEPGSTLKSVLLAAALTRGWRLTDLVWGGMGKFEVQGKKISEAETHEKFSWLSLKKMIQVSSNIGAAKVALKLGGDRYFRMLKAFGFGQKTETGFPGEVSGRVPPFESSRWQPLTLANIGFGQGIAVTPMQMTRAYAVFLNGGGLIQPTFLRSPDTFIQSPETGVQRAKPLIRVISKGVSSQVLEALEGVTQEGGTGTKARLPGYRIGGKTGTAQRVDPSTKGYSHSSYVASFVGFALDVEPKIVVFCSLDEPKKPYYASETAAPLFGEVMAEVANRLSMPADRIQLSQAKTMEPPHSAAQVAPSDISFPLEWSSSAADGTLIWKMPLLRGLTPREAIQVFQGHRFYFQASGVGVVQDQVPEEGKTIAEGDMIRLNLVEP